ncbi:hypothetical protein OO25_03415 [Phaeobacter sp. S60]|nr:hypothetical protein OO25_03415 [Phaeobacter sp. S60]
MEKILSSSFLIELTLTFLENLNARTFEFSSMEISENRFFKPSASIALPIHELLLAPGDPVMRLRSEHSTLHAGLPGRAITPTESNGFLST